MKLGIVNKGQNIVPLVFIAGQIFSIVCRHDLSEKNAPRMYTRKLEIHARPTDQAVNRKIHWMPFM